MENKLPYPIKFDDLLLGFGAPEHLVDLHLHVVLIRKGTALSALHDFALHREITRTEMKSPFYQTHPTRQIFMKITAFEVKYSQNNFKLKMERI